MRFQLHQHGSTTKSNDQDHDNNDDNIVTMKKPQLMNQGALPQNADHISHNWVRLDMLTICPMLFHPKKNGREMSDSGPVRGTDASWCFCVFDYATADHLPPPSGISRPTAAQGKRDVVLRNRSTCSHACRSIGTLTLWDDCGVLGASRTLAFCRLIKSGHFSIVLRAHNGAQSSQCSQL